MEQTIIETMEKISDVTVGNRAIIGNEPPKNPQLNAILFANRRREGFCDCCCKDVPPRKLIRQVYRGVNREMRYTIVAYLCAACDLA